MLTFCVSCKKTSGDRWKDTLTGGLIYVACDDDFENLMEAEIASFSAFYDTAYIIPIYKNEKEVIRLLIDDTVRLAIATRDISESEKREMKAKNRVVRKSLIAFDGIALITSKLNKDSLIGLPTLKKILTGEISDWSQINPENKAGVIRILFTGKESSVLRYMVDSVMQTTDITSNLYALGSVSDVIEKTAQMPNALGLIGFNHLSDEYKSGYADIMSKIKLMRVSKEDKAVQENSYLPYAGDIRTGNYPLWRSVFVLVSDPRSGLSTGFGVFLVNQIGQKVVQKSGLLPITDTWNKHVEITDKFPQNK